MFRRKHSVAGSLFAMVLALAWLTPLRAQTPEQLKLLESLPSEQRASIINVLPALPATPTATPAGGQQQVGRPAPQRLEPAKDNRPVPGFEHVKDLRPFGENLFFDKPVSDVATLDIPVPTDYVVGPGDTLKVQYFGKSNNAFNLVVGRDGMLNLPEIGPISAAGMTFEALSAAILERVSKQKIGVEATVSMGTLRSIQVFILGEVMAPGPYTVSALTTVSSALLVGGGLKATGSLRRIELRRGGRNGHYFDFYQTLLRGDTSRDVRLQSGDVIFVPPVGKRVALAGQVLRPAIYELLNERSAEDVLALGGGVLPNAFAKLSKLDRVGAAGVRETVEQDLSSKARRQSLDVRDGDVLQIGTTIGRETRFVRLFGSVERAGTYAWRAGMSVADLIPSVDELSRNAYRLFAVLRRTDSVTGMRSYVSINLLDAIQSGKPALDNEDELLVFSREDVEFLSSGAVVCDAPTEAVAISGGGGSQKPAGETVNATRVVKSRPCPAIFDDRPDLLAFVLQQVVRIRGEVMLPGVVPIVAGTTVQTVVGARGGFLRDADEGGVEVSRLQNTADGRSKLERTTLGRAALAGPAATLQPGDEINVRKRFSDRDRGTVTLAGEFVHPGIYDIRRGERLSEVIQRAGNLTTQAYAYGAVFEREQVKQAKREMYQRAALDMQESIAIMTNQRVSANDRDKGSDASLEAMKTLVATLATHDPSGRMVVEADPTVLQVRPEADILLEPGDKLTVPKRPSQVYVMGRVLNPGALQFQSGVDAGGYIRLAGGAARLADMERTFMILPNGNAEPIQVASWNAQPTSVPPGTTIYIPVEEIKPSSLSMFRVILEITKDIALTAAALVSIANN